jgi:hypothetical protein
MDDNDQDKSIIEKTIEAVKTIASDAAKKALETEPLRPGEQVMMLPLMDSGLATEPMMPPFVVLPRRKSRAKTALTAKKAAKKPAAKKSSKKKKAAKAWKPAAKAVAKKKTAKKTAKKKKSKR